MATMLGSVSWVCILPSLFDHFAENFDSGRRVISAYLYLLLSSSPHLKPSDDLEAIVAQTLNTYVLGEHIGSKWGLGRVMRWTPTLKADKSKDASPTLLKGVGLYKVQGDAVAAVIGGIFEQFVRVNSLYLILTLYLIVTVLQGASTAHRTFHTRVLPHILASKSHAGLPEAFHEDVRSACNRFGGLQGPLVIDSSSLPLLTTDAKIMVADSVRKEKETTEEVSSSD